MVLWLIGVIISVTFKGLIHVLLVVALVMLIVRFMRRPPGRSRIVTAIEKRRQHSEGELMRDKSLFSKFARATARITGRAVTFVLAGLTIVVWAACGPLFGYSDTWQLVINTSTTIVTFLMVFLIQNTQYRDSEAVQLKLDELIRAVHGAENSFLDLEELTEEELDSIKKHYLSLAESRSHETGKSDHPKAASVRRCIEEGASVAWRPPWRVGRRDGFRAPASQAKANVIGRQADEPMTEAIS